VRLYFKRGRLYRMIPGSYEKIRRTVSLEIFHIRDTSSTL